ncbi:hypothetical protein KEM54_005458 [Ascosphaera aggregata]|nr:hypothetical protein KEM54_005458 [Ascosphaera aggregata]
MGSQVIRERLPPQVEKLLRRQREITEAFLTGQGKDTRITSLRYMAYTHRMQTMAAASQYYWARVAEAAASTKPLLSRSFLRCALGLTGIYLVADLTNEGIKAYHRNMRALALPTETHLPSTRTVSPTSPPVEVGAEDALIPCATKRLPVQDDWRSVVAERAVFQVLSSFVLPAAALTAVVRHSTKALSDSGSVIVRRWGPLAIGLGIVPMLPYAFDEPVDRFVRATFDPLYTYIEESREAREAREVSEL